MHNRNHDARYYGRISLLIIFLLFLTTIPIGAISLKYSGYDLLRAMAFILGINAVAFFSYGNTVTYKDDKIIMKWANPFRKDVVLQVAKIKKVAIFYYSLRGATARICFFTKDDKKCLNCLILKWELKALEADLVAVGVNVSAMHL